MFQDHNGCNYPNKNKILIKTLPYGEVAVYPVKIEKKKKKKKKKKKNNEVYLVTLIPPHHENIPL